ncbi:MAG: NAD-dependent epimerase/dehydratase family protein, partial [Actinomycetota bacterium]
MADPTNSNLRDKEVIVTGGGGFLGGRIVAHLESRGAKAFVVRMADYDLTKPEAVRDLLNERRAPYMIHAAAVVGGIGANREHPGRFFYENAIMGLHLIHEAMQAGVEKMVTVGTVCSYP